MHKQNVRDFPQTKLVSEINSFLLNKHGDPPFFFQVFAKNSKKSPLLNVFWPRPGLQANHKTADKVQYSWNQATKNSLNEAILLMSINGALHSTLCLSGNQDLTLYEGDSKF